MKVEMETITPAKAAKMLERNTRNRHLRPTLVSRYARDMEEGRWLKTHQGIAINCDGTLLDGQHRLAAIIESGKPQEFLVARGVPTGSQVAMDDGAGRSAPDAISLDRGVRVDALSVAIVRSIVQFAGGNNRGVSKQETAALLDDLREPLAFIEPFVATKQRGVTASPVWASIALAWHYVEDLERLREFCRIFCGHDLPMMDFDRTPVMLREWLLRTGAVGHGMRKEAFEKTQRAIVTFMDRKVTSKLYGSSTFHPWPLVDPVR